MFKTVFLNHSSQPDAGLKRLLDKLIRSRPIIPAFLVLALGSACKSDDYEQYWRLVDVEGVNHYLISLVDRAYLIPEGYMKYKNPSHVINDGIRNVYLHATFPDAEPWTPERDKEMYDGTITDWMHRIDITVKVGMNRILGKQSHQYMPYSDRGYERDIDGWDWFHIVDLPHELPEGWSKFTTVLDKDAVIDMDNITDMEIFYTYHDPLDAKIAKYTIRCGAGPARLCNLDFLPDMDSCLYLTLTIKEDNLVAILPAVEKITHKIAEFERAAEPYRHLLPEKGLSFNGGCYDF